MLATEEQGVEVVLLKKIVDDLSVLSTAVGDVRERLTRIESQGAIARIERNELAHAALLKRIEALESDRDKRTGMTDLIGWVIKSAPWIAAMIVGAVAYVLKGHIS